MKLLTKDSDYAIRALIYLAKRRGVFTSSTQIASEEHIPLQFIRRILQQLTKSNMIQSKEGLGGGVQLVVEAGTIRLIDIIKMFQGELQLSDCMFRKKICGNRAHCVIRRRIMSIEAMVAKEFAQVSIQSLIDDIGERTHEA